MNHLISIAGPTAVGKTELSLSLAEHFNADIISADSRQFYREISIGTCKPLPSQLARVKHHFINRLSVESDYNAGLFEKDALQCLEVIFSRRNIAFLVGGSGLYLKALCEGFDSLPEKNEELRAVLESELALYGVGFLAEKLRMLDPEYYAEVDRLNPQRLIRAIEVCELTGKKYSELRQQPSGNTRNFSVLKIGLNIGRKELYARIDARVDEMMQQGLINEVRAMLPYRHYNSLQTVGYPELFGYFDGSYDLESAVELIKRNTRRFAKRQITWFIRDPDINWFEPGQEDEIIKLIREKTKE